MKFEITECNGALSREQLEKVLARLPVTLKTIDGVALPEHKYLQPGTGDNPTIMLVSHSAQVISLKPQKGKRVCDGAFYGSQRAFNPSRVLDETLGHGESNSYSFDTKDIGLPFSKELMLDIYKFP